MSRPSLWPPRLFRICARAPAVLAAIGLGGCGGILDVDYPGRIPAEQVDDPSLAPVLALSVVGDLECAYDNYVLATAVHSDEFEGVVNHIGLVNWSHRSLPADDAEYVSGQCAGGIAWTPGGIHVPMQTARFLSEFVFTKLNGWTDAQVANRTALLATVRAYGGYTYTFFGETYCSIAFDRGPEVPPVDALHLAEQRFADAISLAQTAGATDILNMARVGMARVKMDLKTWSEAATFATQVPAGFRKDADRGTENDRRYNKIFAANVQSAVYVVGLAYRTMNDPRVMVADAGHDTGSPSTRFWFTTKYPALGSPIRLASYKEAQLILTEAQAQQGQVAEAQQTINTYRAGSGLPPLTFASQADAITQIIEERRRELSFEGGHRLNDLLRKSISWKVGSSPFDGKPYGAVTCWPFPIGYRSGV